MIASTKLDAPAVFAAHQQAHEPHDVAKMIEFIGAKATPGLTYEIRGLPEKWSRTIVGGDAEGVRRALAGLAGCGSIHMTLNPVRADLGDKAASAADVARREWILIDVDAIKAAPDGSATDEERRAAIHLAGAIIDHLGKRGFPDPIIVDSGNGWHLLYRIDLPNDAESDELIKRFLKALASIFDTNEAHVDTAVANAARLAKLAGCWNRKGPGTPSRPHRRAKTILVPDELLAVDRERIEDVAGPAPEPVRPTAAAPATIPFPTSVRADSYKNSAIENVLSALAAAPVGERNHGLNKASFAGGRMAAAGWFGRGEIEGRLLAMAMSIGLGAQEAISTIRSGMSAGEKDPRVLPESVLSPPAMKASFRSKNSNAPSQSEWKTHPLGVPRVEAGRFPLEAFPPPIQTIIDELSSSMTTAVDFVGASVLAVAASAIGQSVNISLNRAWVEAPQFYIAQVGPPGKKKSPPLKWLVQSLADIDRDRLEVYRREFEAWDRGDPKARPPQPIRRRTLVQDITTESIAVVHSENPRGLLVHRDELAGWVASFDQYRSKGADRQFWLSNASGIPIQVDRKGGRESLHVPRPLINVCGGLTPDNLGLLAKADANGRGGDVDDGFVDRMIFAYPDSYPSQEWTEAEVSAESELLWISTIRTLNGREMTRDENRDRPWLVGFTPAAKAAWVEWYDRHMAQAEREFSELNEYPERPPSGRLGGIWSKYRATCARIALVISRLRAAVEADEVPYGSPRPVSEEDVGNAILLVEYFKRTARKVLAGARGGQVKLSDDEKACIDWFSHNEEHYTFTSNDINSSLGRFRGNSDRLKNTLDSLIKLGCIRPLPLPPTGKPGRPPSPSFEINPHLRSFNSGNSGNPLSA
jgi:hypothetical protein